MSNRKGTHMPEPYPKTSEVFKTSEVLGGPAKEEAMSSFIKILAKSRLLKGDLDLHLVRGSMVLIFVLFGYQKWFEYEVETLDRGLAALGTGPGGGRYHLAGSRRGWPRLVRWPNSR